MIGQTLIKSADSLIHIQGPDLMVRSCLIKSSNKPINKWN